MLTLSKIAKLAHVSVSTVSKAFMGSNEVNEQTRNEIFDIAKQNNCFKKYYNVKYPKYVIAVIAPEFHSRLYSTYLTTLQAELTSNNCELCVASTNFSLQTEADLLDYYTKYTNVDGIICVSHRTDLKTEIKIPIATISGKANPGIINVGNNIDIILDDIVKFFKDLGIKNIGFIGEALTNSTFDRYKSSMKKNHLDINDNFISISDKRFEEGGYQAAEEFFKRGSLPEAIIAAYDNIALGAMRCITEHGLKIPDDIAIIGLNDNSESAYANPPLSSVNFSVEETCRVAVRELLNKINGNPVIYDNTVDYSIILRKSTDIPGANTK